MSLIVSSYYSPRPAAVLIFSSCCVFCRASSHASPRLSNRAFPSPQYHPGLNVVFCVVVCPSIVASAPAFFFVSCDGVAVASHRRIVRMCCLRRSTLRILNVIRRRHRLCISMIRRCIAFPIAFAISYAQGRRCTRPARRLRVNRLRTCALHSHFRIYNYDAYAYSSPP